MNQTLNKKRELDHQAALEVHSQIKQIDEDHALKSPGRP